MAYDFVVSFLNIEVHDKSLNPVNTERLSDKIWY